MKTGLQRVQLKTGRDHSLRRFHPWVYSGAIEQIDSGIGEGDVVEVVDASGGFLACAFYSDSSIALKVFSFRKVEPSISYWQERIQAAAQLRQKFSLHPQHSETNCYRLVNGEGDGLPGLIVDIYRDIAVIQCHSVGMFRLLECWSDALLDVYPDSIANVYSKSGNTLQSEEADSGEAPDRFINGQNGQTVVTENGRKFFVDVVSGQKTGFFIDQRDSRAMLAKVAEGKKVLNLFSYTGGFSVAAAHAGATQVTSVDASDLATQILKRNYQENNLVINEQDVVCADCFTFLENTKERYDVIVVDPPPFAKSRSAGEKALQGYKAINNLALKRLASNGMLFTFSCSQVVDRVNFERAVADAAIETGRQMQIIERLGSPNCHPCSIHHPEGDYLKGIFLTARN